MESNEMRACSFSPMLCGLSVTLARAASHAILVIRHQQLTSWPDMPFRRLGAGGFVCVNRCASDGAERLESHETNGPRRWALGKNDWYGLKNRVWPALVASVNYLVVHSKHGPLLGEILPTQNP